MHAKLRRSRLPVFTLLAALLPASPAGAQQPTPPPQSTQQATITGRVVERATQQPLPGVRVSIVGQTRAVPTNDEGEYRLAGLDPGTYTLRALRIGYEAEAQTVTVAAGQTATVNFTMGATAVSLEQVTITATGEQIRTRETGNVVASITPAEPVLAATENVTDLLTARAPGVNVQLATGTVGTASRIRIRGANSVSLNNEPLLVIDGVRANNDVGNRQIIGGGTNTGVGTGGQVTSRLNDINPEDIESIEIIKGPAGVSLYGTAAANGVIQITTKKGRAGRTQWRAYAEAKQNSLEYIDWPANFAGAGRVVATGNATNNCTNDALTRGACTRDSIVSFNPLEVHSPFRVGDGLAAGASASGGTERVTFFVGADYDRDQGPFFTNDSKRTSFRANLRGQLRDNWDLSVNTGYINSRVVLPTNDNSTLGIISVGLLGTAFDTPEGKGYLNNFTPDELYNLSNRQNVERFITSASSNLQATNWLSFSGVAGLDYVDQLTRQAIQPNAVFFGDVVQGSATSNPFRIYNWTAQANANATFQTGDMRHTTTLGSQFTQERFQGTNAFGAVLTQGSGSLSGTSARFAVSEFNTDNITIGGFLQQQFSWRDRLFLTAAVRGDDNSAFGEDFGFIFYPAFNASWVVSEEGFFPQSDALSSLRLRAAIGRSGQRPQFRNAITFYNPVAVRANDTEVGAITFNAGGVGNLDLKPERTTEYEAGLDLAMFGDRFTAQLTYYDKTTEDALIQRPLPPSAGAAVNRFENIGEMRNRGVEFLLGATVLDTRPARLELNFGGSTLDNELVELGQDIAPIVFNGRQQQHRNGYPAGGYWDFPILGYEDLNGDGIISRANCPGQTQVPGGPECEITLGDTTVFMGNPLPEREFQFNGTLTLFNRVAVRALFEHRGGFITYNQTNRFRCVFRQNCAALNDPNAPLEDQAAAVAGLMGTDAGYMEDGSFTRLRELSATLFAPREWAGFLRASDLSLTIAGRNLYVWTDYRGLDPEINSQPGLNFNSSDFLTVPPTRQWTARLNITF